MRPPQTTYLRVNQAEVILVEIHSLDPKHKKLQDRFIQEVIELLRDTVTTRLELTQKKTGQQKGNKDSTGILTGTNVRIGYAFKNRPGHQTCLYSSNDMQYGTNSTDESLSSLRVVQEKLVVYVQLLGEGSPRDMSQLMRRLSDVNQSMGPGVSISSYFQRASSSQQSQARDTSMKGGTKERKPPSHSLGRGVPHLTFIPNDLDPVMKTDAPPSEGMRHKIKGILERGRFPGKKTKSKKATATGLADEDSHDSFKSVTPENSEHVTPEVSDVMERVTPEKREHVTPEKVGSDFEGQYNSDSEDPEQFRKPLLLEENGRPSHKGMKSNVSTVILNPDCDGSHCFTVSSVDSNLPCTGNTVDLTDVTGSLMKECSSNLNIERETVDTEGSSDDRNGHSSESVKSLGIDVKRGDVTPEENKVSDPSDSSDSDVLPSASFCHVKNDKRLSHLGIDTLKNILKCVKNREPSETPEHGSPVFGGKTGKGKEFEDIAEESSELPESGDASNTNTKENTCIETRVRSLRRFRFKRKLPKFSDSDSEDSLPEKKRQNVSTAKGDKFVNVNVKKANHKRMQIPKDFFCSNKASTSQPKLSFFTKDIKKGKVKDINDNVKGSGGAAQDDPDRVIELIEEIPDCTDSDNELDTKLLQEVQSLSNVEALNEDQIRFLIRRHQTYLRQIFEGKLKCSRHEAYKRGGNSRRELNYASRLGPYTDEQLDVVMECLMAIFCKKHHKYLDYIMKVLLPEILVKFHMEIHNTTQEESEYQLGPRTPEQPSSSSS